MKLIQLHKFLFFAATFFTLLSVFLNLYWNSFLADMLDSLGNAFSFKMGASKPALFQMLLPALSIVLFHTVSEYLSSYLAAYTCEIWAHEMRMGYCRFYLQSNIRTLSKLKVGEEQSAMQNELREIAVYLNESLFSLMKQFISFVVTVAYLLYQNYRLALVSTLPVIPLIIYCSFSSKIIKSYTEQCQKSKQQINGLTDTVLELFPIIQVYDGYRLMDQAMDKRLIEWRNSNIKKERVAARLMSLSGALSFIPLLVLLGVGGFMVIDGQITLGIFYVFINLSGNVSGFLQNMPNIYAGFRRFGVSVGRLEQKLIINASERRKYV